MEQRTTRDAESLDKWRKEAIRLHQKEIDDKNKESKSVRKPGFSVIQKLQKGSSGKSILDDSHL